MARILPDLPLGASTPEVARLHRLLKALPDSRYVVWQRLTLHPEPGPDFWVLREDQRAVWIQVSRLTAAAARRFQQEDLFDHQGGRPAEPEHQAISAFRQCHFRAAAEETPPVPALVVFPNLTATELQPLQGLASLPPDVRWAGREVLTPTGLLPWLEAELGPPLPPAQVDQLRAAFVPETIIPSQFTVRPSAPLQRNIQAQLTTALLDIDQEQALKLDLELPAEAQAAANDFNLRLVNGVAGSGKSLILLFRAQLLRQLYPDHAILGISHNRALIRDLQARYRRLQPQGKPVEWLTFYQWCDRLRPPGEINAARIGAADKRRLITDLWQRHLAHTHLSEHALHDELDWCKDQLIFSRQEYLAANRSGRGFALTEAQRQIFYTAFEDYQTDLQRRHLTDWGDVPRNLWRRVRSGTIELPHYDAILIDEAQFFAPLWFELIKRAIQPGTGQLFLVADPTQGFLRRGQSWLASGLDVRGRVHRLKKSYRTTHEILNFATLLYRQRIAADPEDIVLPDLMNMPQGVLPQIIPLTSEQDETTRIVNEIETLLQQGFPKKHLLIIHADWIGRDRLLERLRARFGARAAVDPAQAVAPEAIRICTLNAVTGLESPVVFIAGVHALFEQEQSIRLSDEERAELIRDNTRKLYMALTRAGQRVVLTYAGELPPVLQWAPPKPDESPPAV